MYPLLETIRCADGKLDNMLWHNSRFNRSRNACFGISDSMDLAEIIEIPEQAKTGIFRCRVIYSTGIEKIEFLPHYYRKITHLKLIEDNSIDYRFKYADRTHLQKLFTERGECDDILIIKNGCISDSYTANPVFFDGKKWWTPDTPLLPGTQRARMLHEGIISTCRITPDDISKYKKVSLINAMQDIETMPYIPVQNILR